MKNRFVFRFLCVAVALILCAALFACDRAENDTEKESESVTLEKESERSEPKAKDFTV